MTRLLPFALAAALLATACGDDDAVSVTEEEIVGTWDVESADFDVDVRATINGAPFDVDAAGATTASDGTITFDPDGTYAMTGAYSADVTVSGTGLPESTQPGTASLAGASGRWRLAGTTLSLTGRSFTPAADFDFGFGLDGAFDAQDIDAEITEFSPGQRMTFVSRIDSTVITQTPNAPATSQALRLTQTIVLTQ